MTYTDEVSDEENKMIDIDDEEMGLDGDHDSSETDKSLSGFNFDSE